jgi:hypothetical protein
MQNPSQYNYQYYEEPLTVQNGNQVYCPYIKTKNKQQNSGLPQLQTLDGKPVQDVCLPHLSYRGPVIGGFGNNICHNNKPVHLNFITNEKNECHSDTNCMNKMEVCQDPYMGM